ncbi:MAG: ATP-binding cassette domain-containing protein [Actinobacteria bacterium]|nr:ATP-binding cassette domain-containing protein [Actinomycetota bacterium]
MEKSGAILEGSGLRLHRGGRLVLDGIDVSFRAGTVAAVVGPSGAGKTSLLRCLNRLEQPEAGTVSLDGTDIREIPPTELRRRVGMIFQTPVLFPGGVRSNLCYGLEGVAEEVLLEALAAAGLAESFLNRDSTALSVGQAQRVSIARALVRSPEMLLMDEPTSALDKDAAGRIEALVSSLAERGPGVVVVTHDLEQAERMAECAVLIVDGVKYAEGTVDEVRGSWPKERA